MLLLFSLILITASIPLLLELKIHAETSILLNLGRQIRLHMDAMASLLKGFAAAAVVAALLFGSASILASWIPGYGRVALGVLCTVYFIRHAIEFVDRIGYIPKRRGRL